MHKHSNHHCTYICEAHYLFPLDCSEPLQPCCKDKHWHSRYSWFSQCNCQASAHISLTILTILLVVSQAKIIICQCPAGGQEILSTPLILALLYTLRAAKGKCKNQMPNKLIGTSHFVFLVLTEINLKNGTEMHTLLIDPGRRGHRPPMYLIESGLCSPDASPTLMFCEPKHKTPLGPASASQGDPWLLTDGLEL